MFGRKEVVAEVKVEPEVPNKVALPDDVSEEYRALQVKLGIGIGRPTYDLASVKEYLNNKYGGWSQWCWVPLRGKDVVKGINFNDIENRTYTKPIPFAVLKTIDEIQETYPQAKFFISDERYNSDVKDPFLLVTLDNGHCLHVVERWDEPAFR